MVSLRFCLFVSVILCISTVLAAVQVHPVARAVSSSATCIDTFSWMNDAQDYSPCLTVAYVEAACIGNDYIQPVLQNNYSYSLPNSSSESPCYCSWSSYNLMMACTLCQGSNFTNSVWTWPTWASGCTANSSWTQEYFPSGGYELAGNASIPYWATTNPTTWTYATFNIQDANATYSQNPSNITPGATSSSSSGSSSTPSSSSTSNSSSKSTDVGAIVGGTVGGAAALLLVAFGAYLLYRRHVYKQGRYTYASFINQQRTTPHNRNPSDSSNFSPSIFGPPVLYGQSASLSQPQTTYPSLQGSFSPPPRTETSVYTTHTSSGQRSEAIPLV